jgi:hypothetical protein
MASFVADAERRRQRMAVRTQQAQVLEPVVIAIAVDVIELERDGVLGPSLAQAKRTSRRQQAFVDKPQPQRMRLHVRPMLYQEVGERLCAISKRLAEVRSLPEEVTRIDAVRRPQ